MQTVEPVEQIKYIVDPRVIAVEAVVSYVLTEGCIAEKLLAQLVSFQGQYCGNVVAVHQEFIDGIGGEAVLSDHISQFIGPVYYTWTCVELGVMLFIKH